MSGRKRGKNWTRAGTSGWRVKRLSGTGEWDKKVGGKKFGSAEFPEWVASFLAATVARCISCAARLLSVC